MELVDRFDMRENLGDNIRGNKTAILVLNRHPEMEHLRKKRKMYRSHQERW